MTGSASIKTLLIFLTASLLLLAASPAIAADQGEITINFQDVDISTVINSVSRITGRTFIVDPRVKGKVTVIASEPVAEKELYSIFLSILQVHDLAAIETDGVTKIIPVAMAKHDSTAMAGGERDGMPADSIVTTLYKLKHIPADRLVPILRPLVPSKSYLAAEPQSNMLIISARRANIARLIKIIEKIDRAKTGEIETIRLEYADAGEIVRVIEGLERQQQKKGSPDNRLKLIADERTNSILISGSEYNLLRIRSLISHLDSPIETEGSTRVVFLRYAKAKDLMPILKGVEPPGEAQKGKVSRSSRSEVNIQADESTNALVITAPPGTMKSLLSVIRKLDIRRAQVMIEAVIAEVSTGDGAEFGVQWRSTDLRSSDDTGVAGGTSFNSGGSGPSINNPLGLGSFSGLNLGYFRGSTEILDGFDIPNLGALVTALSTDADTNILSTPSLVTMDNEEAEIVVGKTVPFATGSYTSTGSGSTPENPFTTYEREDVGLKLKVTPQISAGDTIRLDIVQEVSNLTSDTNILNVGLQTTATRLIKTSVLVDDGKILVLGGLISDDIQETIQKVPLLGSIPIIGWLFRYTKTIHQKQNLMVFLRPTILRDQEDGSRITFDKYDYIRKLQQDFSDRGVPLMPNAKPPVLPEYDLTE